ncbi:AT hook motif protein [Streptomyces sp. WAC07149]|uniref:AT hook motif protein n=1 Tax=Streptomyces sp. WAC07149 TaxID=2487425 RepID=UPI000F77431C|nr:AT hook motif protein [Streptomyces sp. WAC07149]RST06130.1 AT hook motif protein [Streptomyces sp. WAC07149]
MTPAAAPRPGGPQGQGPGSGPGSGSAPGPAEDKPARAARQARKQVLLRLDPQVYDALARWAGEELRSANAQIEFLLRRALSEAGRLPGGAAPIPPRGRPRNAGDP